MNGEEEEEGVIPFARFVRAQDDRRLSSRPSVGCGREVLSLLAARHMEGVMMRLAESGLVQDLKEKA